MPTTTVGKLVWWARQSDKAGPYPAVVVEAGDAPTLTVFFPDSVRHFVGATHWLVEDGTDYGWFDIPIDGQVPPDFFD